MSKRLAAITFLAGSLLVVLIPSPFKALVGYLDLKTYDAFMFLRGPKPPPDDLVIVAIDNPSRTQFAQLGFPYPWPRGVHGELIGLLDQLGARVTVFDVLFDLPSGDPAQDQQLAQAIASSSTPVVLAASVERVDDPRFKLETENLPLQIYLDAGARTGFVNLTPDPDGVVRSAPLSVKGEPTLSARTYQLLGGSLEEDIPTANSELLVNYVGGGRRILTVSYWQALDYEASLPEGIFQDKIVLVGRSESIQDLSAGGEQDIFLSPFDLLGEGAGMPGVEIHANVLNQLLRQDFLGRLRPGSTVLITVLLASAVAAVLLLVAGLRRKITLSLTIIFGYVVVSWLIFLTADLWMLTIQPCAAASLTLVSTSFWEYRRAERERRQIRQALKGYVSAPVMNQILNNPHGLELGGETVIATVLFSDIARFSKIAEKTQPRELASLLNEYFTRTGDAIMSRQGMINKYIGDAVMALWGVPLPTENHAVLACEAALEMKKIVDEMPEIHTRIGINTGSMVAGNMGHQERMEYTVIGDEVNLASRLEGANKAFGTSVIISESTEELLDGKFVLRHLDWIRVVGKDRPVRVFELVARSGEALPPETQAMLDSYSEILQAYEQREWKHATKLCLRHLELFPQDTVVAMAYLPRCRQFAEQPPPADWDGVYELTTK